MASSVVGSAAKQLGALLVEEAHILYAVSDNIKRLQKEFEWMQCFLEDADNRQHKEKVVRKWVAEIRDFAYEAEDLIEKYLHEVSYPRQQGIWNTVKWSFFVLGDALTLHGIGSSVDDLRARISDLTSKLQVYGVQIIKHSDNLTYNSIKEQRRTYSHVEEVPVGLDTHIEAVMKELIDTTNQSKVVGINGMGGLGKTTLAKKLYTEDNVKTHFHKRVWVYISKECDPPHVFREILSQMGENGENPEMICKALREKKCLLVLDDIWDTDSWKQLSPAFPSNETGSKILITTRNSKLVQEGYYYSEYSYKGLTDEDSWKLLQQKAFLEGDVTEVSVSDEMKELGKDMLKHCHGLPLAIIALGGILASRRTPDEWKTVLKDITSYLTRDKGQESWAHKMLAMLELSYDELPYYLKPCFMYLGCFPKESEISAQRLYHLWEAEGMFSNSVDDMEQNEGVSLDDLAKSYLNELVKRSMVEVVKTWANGEIKTCRLHGIMREMCLKKCKEVNFLKVIKYDKSNKKALSNYTTSKLRRCVLDLGDGVVGDSPFADHLNEAPCIRSLLAFSHGSDCAGKLLTGNNGNYLSLLRILDLEGTSIDLIPEVIGDFIHLRYLSLRRTGASGLLQCIWACKYLETLDLRTGSTLTLSNEFQKLGRLRHLFLPSSMQLLDPAERLSFSPHQLSQVETLKNFDIEICKTEELMEMTNLRKFSFVKTKQLKDGEILGHFMKSPLVISKCLGNQLCLNIRSDVITEKPEILSHLTSVEVSLRMFGRIEPSCQAGIFVENLKRLYLESSEIGQEEITVLEKLTHLKELRLNKKAVRDEKMSFSDGGFPQLAKLYFCELDLQVWEVGKEALPKLRCLFIYLCRKMENIPRGLPSSVWIYCRDRIDGMERYKTCPYPEEAADQNW